MNREPMQLPSATLYNVLHGLANIVRPKTYLEIGVLEGATVCTVLAQEHGIIRFVRRCLMEGHAEINPQIGRRIGEAFTLRKSIEEVYLFDDWSQNKRENGDHIVNLLKQGFNVDPYMADGDSRRTIPALFKNTPDLIIDLALVDGDHSEKGALADLDDVIPHSCVVVTHDIYHPDYPWLPALIRRVAARHGCPYVMLGRLWFGTAVFFNLSLGAVPVDP